MRLPRTEHDWTMAWTAVGGGSAGSVRGSCALMRHTLMINVTTCITLSVRSSLQLEHDEWHAPGVWYTGRTKLMQHTQYPKIQWV